MKNNGMFFIILLISNILFSMSILSQPASAQSNNSNTVTPSFRIGTNISPPTYYTDDAEFIDFFCMAAPFQQNNGGPFPTISANGYPTNPEGGACFFEPIGYPIGNYQYYGEGSFDLRLNFACNPNGNNVQTVDNQNYMGFVPGSVSVSYETHNGQTTRITRALVNLQFPQAPFVGDYTYGIPSAYSLPDFINITNVSSTDPPNNMHLIRPDYNPWPETQNDVGYPFGKEYLQALAPFCAIRFWNFWNPPTNFGISSWNSIPYQPNLWGYWGVSSVQTMVQLCNVTNSDMWMIIPLTATSDFDTNFAQYVKANLKSNLHCYYEIGDELWNWAPAYWPDWNTVEMMSQNNTPPAGLPPYSGVGGWQQHGEAMASVLMSHSRSIQPILGSQGRPVLSAMFYVTVYETGGLNYIQNAMGLNPADVIYGIAGAPYFANQNGDPDLKSLFADMNQNITQLAPILQQHLAIVNQYNLRYLCYESGQSLYSQDPGTWSLLQAAQTDPRMAATYTQYFNCLQTGGCDLTMNFDFISTDSKYGFWGIMNSILDMQNPPAKYSAVAQAAAACNCGNAPPPPPQNTGNSNSNNNSSSNTNSGSSSNSNSSSSNSNSASNSGSSSSGSSGRNSGSNTNSSGSSNNQNNSDNVPKSL